MSNTPEPTNAPVPETDAPAVTPAAEAETASPEVAPSAVEAPAAAAAQPAPAKAEKPAKAAKPAKAVKEAKVEKAAETDDEELFRQMLEESLRQQPVASSGEIIRGIVVGADREVVMIDVGGKNEGRVSASEFEQLGEALPAVGDEIEIMVQHSGDRGGSTYSVIAARRNALWEHIEASLNEQSIMQGKVSKEVKGGLRVQLGGIEAFMPAPNAIPACLKTLANWSGKMLKWSLSPLSAVRKMSLCRASDHWKRFCWRRGLSFSPRPRSATRLAAK